MNWTKLGRKEDQYVALHSAWNYCLVLLIQGIHHQVFPLVKILVMNHYNMSTVHISIQKNENMKDRNPFSTQLVVTYFLQNDPNNESLTVLCSTALISLAACRLIFHRRKA